MTAYLIAATIGIIAIPIVFWGMIALFEYALSLYASKSKQTESKPEIYQTVGTAAFAAIFIWAPNAAAAPNSNVDIRSFINRTSGHIRNFRNEPNTSSSDIKIKNYSDTIQMI